MKHCAFKTKGWPQEACSILTDGECSHVLVEKGANQALDNKQRLITRTPVRDWIQEAGTKRCRRLQLP